MKHVELIKCYNFHIKVSLCDNIQETYDFSKMICPDVRLKYTPLRIKDLK
jgi:hypothetical protein